MGLIAGGHGIDRIAPGRDSGLDEGEALDAPTRLACVDDHRTGASARRGDDRRKGPGAIQALPVGRDMHCRRYPAVAGRYEHVPAGGEGCLECRRVVSPAVAQRSLRTHVDPTERVLNISRRRGVSAAVGRRLRADQRIDKRLVRKSLRIRGANDCPDGTGHGGRRSQAEIAPCCRSAPHVAPQVLRQQAIGSSSNNYDGGG